MAHAVSGHSAHYYPARNRPSHVTPLACWRRVSALIVLTIVTVHRVHRPRGRDLVLAMVSHGEASLVVTIPDLRWTELHLRVFLSSVLLLILSWLWRSPIARYQPDTTRLSRQTPLRVPAILAPLRPLTAPAIFSQESGRAGSGFFDSERIGIKINPSGLPPSVQFCSPTVKLSERLWRASRHGVDRSLASRACGGPVPTRQRRRRFPPDRARSADLTTGQSPVFARFFGSSWGAERERTFHDAPAAASRDDSGPMRESRGGRSPITPESGRALTRLRRNPEPFLTTVPGRARRLRAAILRHVARRRRFRQRLLSPIAFRIISA